MTHQRRCGHGFVHGQIGEDLNDLETARQAEPRHSRRCKAGDVSPLKGNTALVGRLKARNERKQRCLPGAVRADQRDDFLRRDVERHAIDCGKTTEALGDADNAKKRLQ